MVGKIGIGLLAIVVLLAIPFGLAFYDIAFTRTMGTAQQNAQTDVIRQSNQYVTTQQQALLQKMSDYQRVGAETPKTEQPTPQQKAIISEMKLVAGTLPPDRIPTDVAIFLAAH